MRLAVLGASARAAACSAVACGHQVVAADLFADADLAGLAEVTRIDDWPSGFVPWLHAQQVDGWLYTGGLENHPPLVDELVAIAPLLGNAGPTLKAIQRVEDVAQLLAGASCHYPEVRRTPPLARDHREWLRKSLATAGGMGVARWNAAQKLAPNEYLQQYMAGASYSASFVACGRQASLLGTTRQLVGCRWTGAREFQYTGSIGPLEIPAIVAEQVQQAANLLARELDLRGLLGLDFVVGDDNVAWIVDINPRWSASMEVIERATGIPLVAMHLSACCSDDGGAALANSPLDGNIPHAKAYVFATRATTASDELVAFLWQLHRDRLAADIPQPGVRFEKHDPVCTLFAQGGSPALAERALRERSEEVYRRLHDAIMA